MSLSQFKSGSKLQRQISANKDSILSFKKQSFHSKIRTDSIHNYMKQLRQDIVYQNNSQILLKIATTTQTHITEQSLDLLIRFANDSNDYAIIHLSILILNGIISVNICQNYQLHFKDSFSWLIFFRACLQKQYCNEKMIQVATQMLLKVKLQQNTLALSCCLQMIKILLRNESLLMIQQLSQQKIFLRLTELVKFPQIKISNLTFSIIDNLFQTHLITEKIMNILSSKLQIIKEMLFTGLNNNSLLRKAIKITNNLIMSGYLNVVHSCVQRIIIDSFKLTQRIYNASQTEAEFYLILKQSINLFESILQSQNIEVVSYYSSYGMLNIYMQTMAYYLNDQKSKIKNKGQHYQVSQQVFLLKQKVQKMTQSCFQFLLKRIYKQNETYISFLLNEAKNYKIQQFLYTQFTFIKWQKYENVQLQI